MGILNFHAYLKNYNNFQFNNTFYSELLIKRLNGEILTSEIDCEFQRTNNGILEYFCSSFNINTTNITNIRLKIILLNIITTQILISLYQNLKLY